MMAGSGGAVGEMVSVFEEVSGLLVSNEKKWKSGSNDWRLDAAFSAELFQSMCRFFQ